MMKPSLSAKDEKTLYWIGVGVLAVLVLIGVVTDITGYSLDQMLPPCFFRQLTGLYCPGCGGTRAVQALLHGHLWISFLCHPVVPYVAVVGGWYLVSHTIQMISKDRVKIAMAYRDVYLYLALAIILLEWLVKLLHIYTIPIHP